MPKEANMDLISPKHRRIVFQIGHLKKNSVGCNSWFLHEMSPILQKKNTTQTNPNQIKPFPLHISVGE